jgi:hypothetical protein
MFYFIVIGSDIFIILHLFYFSYCVICVEKNGLTVRVPPTGREQFKFADFTVDPLSSNGLNVVSNGEMQWRMTLTSLFNTQVKDTVQIDENSLTTKRLAAEVQCLFEQGGVAVSCRNCGKKLFIRDRYRIVYYLLFHWNIIFFTSKKLLQSTLVSA